MGGGAGRAHTVSHAHYEQAARFRLEYLNK